MYWEGLQYQWYKYVEAYILILISGQFHLNSIKLSGFIANGRHLGSQFTGLCVGFTLLFLQKNHISNRSYTMMKKCWELTSMKWRETNIVAYGNYAIWFNLLANKTVGSGVSQFLLYISLCFRDFSGGLLTPDFYKTEYK